MCGILGRHIGVLLEGGAVLIACTEIDVGSGRYFYSSVGYNPFLPAYTKGQARYST